MNILKTFLTVLLLAGVQVAYAQKIVTVKAEETYIAPSNISLDEAKHVALERAKANALAEKFGTIVSQSTSTVMETTNGQSDIRMLTLGGTQSKGEWIETVGEPEYDIKFEDGMFVVNVKVTGKAREMRAHNLDIQVKVLKNSLDFRNESSTFQDGDTFYMYFRSPMSGYVAIYMEDDAAQSVSCLLPYTSSNEGSVRVEANKDYIFFAPKDAYDMITDSYQLYSSHSVDYETIYIIFSPNQFYKANARQVQSGAPLELTHDEFMKWMLQNESTDKDMIDIKRHISVQRRASNTTGK